MKLLVGLGRGEWWASGLISCSPSDPAVPFGSLVGEPQSHLEAVDKKRVYSVTL